MALEIAVGVLGAALFAITYWMFWAGLAASAGVLRLRRCSACGHLVPTASGAALSCPYCRHPRAARHVAHHRLRHYLPGEW